MTTKTKSKTFFIGYIRIGMLKDPILDNFLSVGLLTTLRTNAEKKTGKLYSSFFTQKKKKRKKLYKVAYM